MAETKKRVELVTLDTSTSMKIDEDAADSNVNSFENYTLYPEPSSEEEKAVNERVKAYLDNLIVNLSKHDNTDKIKGNVGMFINAIEEIKQKKPKCLLQKAFKDELEEAADQINTAEPLTEKIDYHIELVKELRRLSMPAEQELGKELTQAQLLSKVGKLTANIDKLKRKLIELDNAEIDLEEMDKHTYYTKKPKLQTMIVGLWMKRESYLNRSAHFVGRNLFKRFVYTGTENEAINEIVTKYFINYLNEVKNAEDKHYMPKSRVNGKSKSKKCDGKFSFFSIIELKDHLSSEITKANINYTLTDAELTKIYKDLINEHHDRRMKDQHDSFRTYAQSQYIKPATAADEKDPEFIKKMDENAKNGEEALMKLINEFKAKDQRQNGDLTDDLTLPLGHDDVGDMTESEEEDEDEDDEEDEDEEEDEEEEDEEEDGEEDGEEEDAGDDSESGGQENGDDGDDVINLDDEMEVDEDCVAGPSTRLDM